MGDRTNKMPTHLRLYLLLFGLGVASQSSQGVAQQSPGTAPAGAHRSAAIRDGQHDFDFEIGTWKSHLSRLLHPLTGSTAWVEYDGTSVVRKVWNGRANLVELEVAGPAGNIEALSLRRRQPVATHNRGIQEWPRRVFRSGVIQWQSNPGALCNLGYHAEFVPF